LGETLHDCVLGIHSDDGDIAITLRCHLHVIRQHNINRDTDNNGTTQHQWTFIQYSLIHLDLLVVAGNSRSYRVRNHKCKSLQTGSGFQWRCLPAHWHRNYNTSAIPYNYLHFSSIQLTPTLSAASASEVTT